LRLLSHHLLEFLIPARGRCAQELRRAQNQIADGHAVRDALTQAWAVATP